MRTLLYRFFSLPLTIFFIAFMAFSAQSPAFAQTSDIYTINDVNVDVAGSSALDARNKAYAAARLKAYEMLADKLLSEADRPGLVIPDDTVLEGLVRDFEIVHEKMTSKRYAATLNFRFSPAGVKRTMRVSALPVSEQTPVAQTLPDSPAVAHATAQPDDGYVYSPYPQKDDTAPANGAQGTLLLPWYGPVGRQVVWGQQNPWREAWQTQGGVKAAAGAGIVLPLGDVDDMRDYAPTQPLSRTGNIQALMRRYGAARAVAAVAAPGQSGAYEISLYELTGGMPVPMGRFGVGEASDGATLAAAVQKTATSIAAMPRTPALSDGAALSVAPVPTAQNVVMPTKYSANVRYTGLTQWVSMRSALQSVAGVGGLMVRSISPSQAGIDFTYTGDNAALMAALSSVGLRLEGTGDSLWLSARP